MSTHSSYSIENSQKTYTSLVNAQVLQCTKNLSFEMEAAFPEYNTSNNAVHPFLIIVLQPQASFRYRYDTEQGSHGIIKAQGAPKNKKLFPTVKLENFSLIPGQPVIIKVSLYTNEENPCPHFYKLAGVCEKDLKSDLICKFENLQIKAKKKDEILEILKTKKRSALNARGRYLSDEDLNKEVQQEYKTLKLSSAKLCFEAFYDHDQKTPLCKKVFSCPIENQKDSGVLKITRMSHCSGYCKGGDEVIILCEKVDKTNIEIRFFERNESGDGVAWMEYGEFNEVDVHKQVAICFKTPPYPENVEKAVFVELYRRSDGKSSEPRPFTYIPSDDDVPTRKRKRYNQEIESVSSQEANLDPFSELQLSPEEILQLFNDKSEISGNDGLEAESSESLFNSQEMFSDLSSLTESMDDNSGPSIVYERPCSGGSMLSEFTNMLWHSLETVHTSLIPSAVSFRPEIQKSQKEKNICGKKSQPDQKLDVLLNGIRNILENKEGDLRRFGKEITSIEDEEGNNFLHMAILQKNPDWNLILQMIKVGSAEAINHPNKFKEIPLMLAIKKDYWQVAYCLAKKGSYIDCGNKDGNNCFHIACRHGSLKSLQVLLKLLKKLPEYAKCMHCIDAMNYDGMSPLHVAVVNDSVECVRLLLKSKAAVNNQEMKQGRTALHLAIEGKAHEICKVLLQHEDIDLSVRDFKDFTPMQAAYKLKGIHYDELSIDLMKDKTYLLKLLSSQDLDHEKDDDSDGTLSDQATTDSDDEMLQGDVPDRSHDPVEVSNSKSTTLESSPTAAIRIEKKLIEYLEENSNWKQLAPCLGLDPGAVEKLCADTSPACIIIKSIKRYQSEECDNKTLLLNFLEAAGLQEGVKLIKNL